MMKKKIIFFFGLSLICSFQGLSQAYVPLIDTNAVWKQCQKPYPPGPMIWYTHHWDHLIIGDTTINNTLYKKVGRIDYNVECSEIFTGPYYYSAIREDTTERKVYQYDYYGELLLYDFSLELGDTLHSYIGNNLIAIAVDSIMVGDSYRKRWTYQYNQASAPIDVVEGIGAYTGLFEYMEIFEVHWFLRCYYYKDEPVYMNPFFAISQCDLEIDTCLPVNIDDPDIVTSFNSYPNPFTTTTAIEYKLYTRSNIQFTIYNSIGEMVYMTEDRILPQGTHQFSWSPQHLPAGLYFAVLRSGEGVSVVKLIKQH